MKYLPRPVLTASRPSQTIAQMGPDSMSNGISIRELHECRSRYIHWIRPGKKAFSLRSASLICQNDVAASTLGLYEQ